METQLAFHHIFSAAGAFPNAFPQVEQGRIRLDSPIALHQIGNHAFNPGQEVSGGLLAVLHIF